MTFELTCNPYFEAQLKADLNFYFLLNWRPWQHKRSNTSKVTLLDVLCKRRIFNTLLLEGTNNKQKSGVKAHFFQHQYIETRSCCNYIQTYIAPLKALVKVFSSFKYRKMGKRDDDKVDGCSQGTYSFREIRNL